MTLPSTKPYLIRAIHEWCLDQGFTPYLQVAVDSRSRVPREHVRDGQIVLNVGSAATNQLMLGNEEIRFQARFSGAVFSVLVPVDAVLAIYARENGQGMAFDVASVGTASAEHGQAPLANPPAPDDPPDPKPLAGGRSHLTRIK
ncbi:ClpXP protease specificity-enhancing factor [Georgfuchsia toluolica]|uniref:ClpXP protease specificity-enhancing factor n=1 Tax=Georgfuchsia toluolica TaxID=424218 RepID=A0A916N8Q1_9PROT|nr:ClpXP protease specificity-enhancing factor [Georgfuchsia toluolica]CAG4883527.1 ClpXP protease specificity-enhancing factor [Georgfuchsia toluolica]